MKISNRIDGSTEPQQTASLAAAKIEDLPRISIYADGSSLKNGSPEMQAGAGVVLRSETNQSIKLKAVYLGSLTNQQAEITACAVGLESLRAACRVRIFSDSKYVIETMRGLNRMKANRQFWERLITASLTHYVEWNWMRGHNGDIFQETADRLSRAAATAKDALDKNTLDRLAGLLAGNPSDEVVRMIHGGLKTLAAKCDGAHRADRQGFNKFDSPLGHRFAQKETLDAQETLVARQMLGKYRTQIAGFDNQLALLV